MPVIDIQYDELKQLSGLEKDKEWFIERIPMTGASFEGIEGKALRFEFFPNRPDHYSVEGIARTMKSLYSESTALPEYGASPGQYALSVDETTKDIRPVIVGAVIKNLEFSQGMLKSLIDLQEKLHLTIGRKRRKVAIGIHDMSAITFPLKYASYAGAAYSFSPLGFDREMTLSQIIAEHDKGQEYGWIVGGGPYPLITDAAGRVLSMPPIINGNMTQLTDRTRDVFIDVTGTSEEACSGVLNIISTALADRGGSICDVTIESGGRKRKTPDLNRRAVDVSLRSMNEMLGVSIDGNLAIRLLRRMGHFCELKGEKIEVRVQPFRMDIMHPVDIIEDAAISYGYDNFGVSPPASQTVGGLTRMTSASELVSEIMIGYGYSQVITFMISGTHSEFDRMLRPESESVGILNPVLEESNILRLSLLPGMLLLLEANKHNELPQRIFEIGDVHRPVRTRYFAAVSIHPKATFAEIKSLADAIGRDLKLGLKMGESRDARFIEGRQMSISRDGEAVGIFGELHPEVITNFNLYNPIVALEMDLDKALRLR